MECIIFRIYRVYTEKEREEIMATRVIDVITNVTSIERSHIQDNPFIYGKK